MKPYTRLHKFDGDVSEFVGSPPSRYLVHIYWSLFSIQKAIEEGYIYDPDAKIHIKHCFDSAIWSLQMIRWLGSGATHWDIEDYMHVEENPKDYWKRNGLEF